MGGCGGDILIKSHEEAKRERGGRRRCTNGQDVGGDRRSIEIRIIYIYIYIDSTAVIGRGGRINADAVQQTANKQISRSTSVNALHAAPTTNTNTTDPRNITKDKPQDPKGPKCICLG